MPLDDCSEDPLRCFSLDRRSVLRSTGALAAFGTVPHRAVRAINGRRLVVILLQGGADGLAIVPPVGDPAYARARGCLALPARECLELDGFFALHPAMPNLHAAYKAGEAAFIHAVATPYRGRSHLAALQALQAGTADRCGTGWLNRAAAAIYQCEDDRWPRLISVGPSLPFLLRGPATVFTFTSACLSTEAIRRGFPSSLSAISNHSAACVQTSGINLASTLADAASLISDALTDRPVNLRRGKEDWAFTKHGDSPIPCGPRVAVLIQPGWDTHVRQGGVAGQAARQMASLDKALVVLMRGLQPVWRETIIVIVSEFGRSVAANEQDGSNHGSGTVACVLGGAVRGGVVHVDWPGLDVFHAGCEGDLFPTTDMRGIFKSILRDHFHLSPATLNSTVFPDSESVALPVDLTA